MTLVQGIAPIFGDSPCCFISDEAHIRIDARTFGPILQHGFSFAIDIQAEGDEPSVVLGSGITNRTSLVLWMNADGEKNRLRLDISDDKGMELSAVAQCSRFAAKRLLIVTDTKNMEVHFYELNLAATQQHELASEYVQREPLAGFSSFENELLIGGACIDGHRVGKMSAKVANFMLWKHPLSGREADRLIEDGKTKFDNFYGIEFYEVPSSLERHSVFMDDLANIDRMANKSSLTNADVRECSSILYKWLFDKWHPMLQDLCNELGIQLTFPISTQYGTAGGNAGPLPTIGFQLGLGRRNLLGHRWDTRTAFGNQVIAIVNGVPITVEMLVKFVRHKLGGDHLDVVDRKKWQKELLEISGHLVQDKDFMRIQMREITKTVLDCVREHRIENHL